MGFIYRRTPSAGLQSRPKARPDIPAVAIGGEFE
jgi:hypothetical protein